MVDHASRAIVLAMATEATRAGFRASRAAKRGSAVAGFFSAYPTYVVAPVIRR